MKNLNLAILFILTVLGFSSCSVITGIFKAGMGFGIFIVVAIIILIVVLIAKTRKKQ